MNIYKQRVMKRLFGDSRFDDSYYKPKTINEVSNDLHKIEKGLDKIFNRIKKTLQKQNKIDALKEADDIHMETCRLRDELIVISHHLYDILDNGDWF